MLVQAYNGMIYGAIILSLFAVDYLLGNGCIEIFQAVFCKIVCTVKKMIREEAKNAPVTGPDNPISLSTLMTEVLVLGMTSLILNKYKQYQAKDRIDELLLESKDSLRQTNDFLEKWRLRHINWQVPNEYSYLDEEPQEIPPLKLEVPILHMAIIDTLSSRRSQPERGDAGDSFNTSDSTLLSVNELLDDDLESMTDLPSEEIVEKNYCYKNVEFNNRYLCDVMEEDANSLEED